MTEFAPDAYLELLADAIAEKVAARLADHLASAVADEVATRLADLVAVASEHSRLVSAGELAEIVGVTVDYVYRHAAELGAIEVGDGERPRLRFDAQKALAAWTSRVPSRSSQADDAPAPAGQPRRRRQRATGSGAPLLPIREGRRGVS